MKSVGLLILGLLLGVAGGYMMGIVQEPEGPDLPPPLDRGKEERRETADRQETPERREVSPIETTGPDPAEVSRFVEQFSVPQREPGDGTITGTVTDGEGQPLAGVLVRGTPRHNALRPKDRKRRDLPDTTPLADQVANYVEQRLWQQAETREARTDEAGNYVLAGLGKRLYRVQAWLENHRLSATGGQSWNKRPGDKVDFTAKPLVALEIRVVDNFGQPVEKAQIELASSGQRSVRLQEEWTPQDPVLRVLEGDYKVTASRQRPEEMRSEPRTIVLSATEEPEILRLSLKLTNLVKGRLRLPHGDTRDAFQVHLLRLRPGEDLKPEDLLSSDPGTWVHSYNSFVYRFPDVEPGRYLIGATSRHGRRVIAHARFELVEGTVVQDLKIEAPKPGDFVKVVVLGPGGKKLRSLDFRERIERKGGSHSGSANITASPDGSWAYVPDIQPGAEDSCKIWLTIMSASFGEKAVRVEPSKTPELTVRFEEPAMLALSVRGAATHPEAGRMSVSLESKGDGFTRYGNEGAKSLRDVGSSEVLTVGPVTPGEVTVKLSYKGRERWSNWTIAEKVVSLTAGTNAAAIEIPTLYRLTVEMPEKAKGSQVHLRGTARGGLSVEALVGDDALAAFAGIPAGTYTLQTWSGVRGKMSVTFPGPERIAWKAVKDNALRVRIKDPKGLLAQQGFQTGDRIVSVAGKSLAGGEAALRVAMLKVMAGERVACEVLRGNRRLQLTVGFPEGTDIENDIGGWLQPTHVEQ